MLPCLETELRAAPRFLCSRSPRIYASDRCPRIYGSDSLRCAIRWLGSLRSAARVSLNSMRRRGARIIGRRLYRRACSFWIDPFIKTGFTNKAARARRSCD